jgi:CRISPR-associated protein Csn2
MKLAYPELENVILFEENRVPVLSIENQSFFRKIVGGFYEQIKTGRGIFVLSEDDRLIELNKTCEMILSPFTIAIEDSRIMKRIYKRLEEIALEEEFVETRELTGQIAKYMYRLTDYLECDLAINDDVELQTLFKAMGIKPLYDDSDMMSKLIDYITLLSTTLGIKLIVFVNLRLYLTIDELRLFYDTVLRKKIKLLLLENRIYGEIINCEDVLTIDSDLCEI